ncbi:class II histone deacetylase [Microtetraspora sp. NBRC 16547]|uniref:class II histone deacetylase n=1 Tax=Microtetraspora sp. NBRC 16547 TaxID=3030993 RepID=UPI0024A35633|nr:class II histone deacetylase [Microtetraspora sp. NBRC 16547]GLW98242.1 acetylpolyamine aminohydrolase [Microtetraspora sp. NBRC 16547]
MADVHVFWDARVLDHDTGSGFWEAAPSGLLAEQELHPESAPRIRNMKAVLERGPVASLLTWRPGRLATEEELRTVHDADYIAGIKEVCAAGGGHLTSTTLLSAGSWEPTLAAAGTCLAATDAVLAGECDIAYALVRPPGHHAQPDRADGYCVFSHAALAAQRARDAGLRRVAIVDWDVHHGNGTQECFYSRDDVLTFSIHMKHGAWGPSHPQTGAPDELGIGDGAGFNVNIELPVGAGDRAYADAIERIVAPVMRRYRPELIIAASGQDAATFDANGLHNVTMAGFHRIGTLLGELARELTGGRLVCTQEGGYARSYAAYCLHSTIEGLLGREQSLPDPIAYVPDDVTRGDTALDAVTAALAPYWNL